MRAPIGGCNIVLLNRGGGREGREGRGGRDGWEGREGRKRCGHPLEAVKLHWDGKGGKRAGKAVMLCYQVGGEGGKGGKGGKSGKGGKGGKGGKSGKGAGTYWRLSYCISKWGTGRAGRAERVRAPIGRL